MANVSLTWLGHATFRLDTPGGKRVYVDPWLTGNPKCPEAEQSPERIDVIAITHAHFDHVGDTVELAKRFSPAVISIFELGAWLAGEGVEGADQTAMNKGGTQEFGGIRFTMTNAFHSGGIVTDSGIRYGGEPAGYVVELENGLKIYFAGDTCVFGDMQLIGRIYEPDVAVLPIGDLYTMNPREAAVALELLGTKRCVPCHYGTFPALTGTPAELRRLATGVEVIAPEPGETVEL